MRTAQEKLDEFIEDIQLTFPSLNCEVLINHIKNVKQEYADEKVKNFNRLPNGSNLPVSGNEALRVAVAFAEWIEEEDFIRYEGGWTRDRMAVYNTTKLFELFQNEKAKATDR